MEEAGIHIPQGIGRAGLLDALVPRAAVEKELSRPASRMAFPCAPVLEEIQILRRADGVGQPLMGGGRRRTRKDA